MKVNFFTNTYKINTNFTSREDVRRKTDAFSDELLKEASSGDMPIEKVRQLTQRYLPEITIRPISLNSKKHKDQGGMYHSYITYYRTPPRAEITKKVLDLKIVPNTDKKYFNEYLCTIAHEMAHAFQAADDDTRDDKIINETLTSIPIEKWWPMTDIAYLGFQKIEEEIFKEEILSHKSIKDMNYNINPFETHINRNKLKTIIERKLSEIKKEHPDVNMDFIKKMLYLQAMNEFDAYMTDEKLKEKLYKNYERDDFIPYIYLCLADCLEVEGVE